MSRTADKMSIFRDRMTAHRHMLTVNNLPTKAFDEGISALHDAMGVLAGSASEASALARATLPEPTPAPIVRKGSNPPPTGQRPAPSPSPPPAPRQHAKFRTDGPREPCGRSGCCG